MFFIANICLCVFSEVLLISVGFSEHFDKHQRSLSSKLYVIMLWVTVVLLISDVLSRLDGTAFAAYPVLNAFGNFVSFFFNPLLPILWFLYVHNQVFCNDNETKKLIPLFSVYLVINALLTVASQFNGWYYYFDSNQIYHRGILFILPAVFDQGLMVVSFLLLIWNRKRIEPKYFSALLFFDILPTLCVALQVAFYGISFSLSGIAIALTVIYINTQNQRMNLDYLTGVYNRKQLDFYIYDQIKRSTLTKTFSAILIDLDNFKQINDRLGHQVGDDALKETVALLKQCVHSSDFIARFGGDEFYIILGISDGDLLLKVVEKIRHSIREFNKCGSRPYELGLSMGYCVYDAGEQISVDEFEAKIDRLMYSNKAANKRILDRDRDGGPHSK
jgi:diguanylate cyclase (GGDEF)-like protein